MEFLNNSIDKIIRAIIKILPLSPFAPFIDKLDGTFSDVMGYVNWFIPFGDFLNIIEVWLYCIALFYVYSVIMRWVKLIGD